MTPTRVQRYNEKGFLKFFMYLTGLKHLEFINIALKNDIWYYWQIFSPPGLLMG